MNEPLAGPQTKVERAKRHLRELHAALAAFLGTNPYEVDAGGLLIRVEPVPIHAAAIVSDILYNLRSALDQVAYRAVCVGLGGAPTKPQDIAYPIAESADKYLALRDGRVKGARQDALQAIDATKPYFGGNNVLWRIHRLNIIDKHRVLLTVGSAFRSVNLKPLLDDGWGEKMTGRKIQYPDYWIRPADRMFPLEVGKQMPIISAPGNRSQYQFEVALDEPGIVADAPPLLETVQEMVAVVEGLLPTFATCLK